MAGQARHDAVKGTAGQLMAIVEPRTKARKKNLSITKIVVHSITKLFVDTRQMSTNKPIRPTDAELEILNILWAKGPATVRDIHEALAATKDAGYTTTLKLMQIMLEKGLVVRDASSKTHIYKAAITREQTQGQIVKRM